MTDQRATSAPDNPIVAAIRAVREAQFVAAGEDLDEYVRRLRLVELRSGHRVIDGRAARDQGGAG